MKCILAVVHFRIWFGSMDSRILINAKKQLWVKIKLLQIVKKLNRKGPTVKEWGSQIKSEFELEFESKILTKIIFILIEWKLHRKIHFLFFVSDVA